MTKEEDEKEKQIRDAFKKEYDTESRSLVGCIAEALTKRIGGKRRKKFEQIGATSENKTKIEEENHKWLNKFNQDENVSYLRVDCESRDCKEAMVEMKGRIERIENENMEMKEENEQLRRRIRNLENEKSVDVKISRMGVELKGVKNDLDRIKRKMNEYTRIKRMKETKSSTEAVKSSLDEMIQEEAEPIRIGPQNSAPCESTRLNNSSDSSIEILEKCQSTTSNPTESNNTILGSDFIETRSVRVIHKPKKQEKEKQVPSVTLEPFIKMQSETNISNSMLYSDKNNSTKKLTINKDVIEAVKKKSDQ
ncbi:hypothetical protein ECANGB1_1932 [Enterospora canceri]|uniref:Uncharacterized protein n=1 Tax=Enterospora canceri TaxID=1081671 RepID=A0A1Y1S5E4_9MICR|nr:hypothetical protein ECANGB1_1932 [Enterospora canceri]